MERMLRVSVYREGRMVDDRFVPPDGLVAAEAKALVRLPEGRIPHGHRLFEHREGRPVLRVPGRLAGQVAVDGRTAAPLAPGEVELGPDAKGWVDLGDAKVFFQVAAKPAPVPAAALPKDVRSRLASLDRRYAMALLLAVACEGVALWQVARAPEPLQILDTPIDAYAGFHPIPRLPPPPAPKPVAEETVAKTEKPARPAKPSSAPAEHVEAKPVKPVDREAIRRTPLFVAIASAGGAAHDVFSKTTPTDVLSAFDKVKRVDQRVAVQGPWHKGTANEPGHVDIDPFVPVPGEPPHEVVLKDKKNPKLPDIQIDWGDPSDPPPVEDPSLAAIIAAEIRLRRGAIQHCYERDLKLRPGLHGKVVLGFTLAPDGKVTEVAVEDETLKSPPTDACIETLARGWKLRAHPPEEMPVRFPIVFSAAAN